MDVGSDLVSQRLGGQRFRARQAGYRVASTPSASATPAISRTSPVADIGRQVRDEIDARVDQRDARQPLEAGTIA